MSSIKERIMGAVQVMSNEDAETFWAFIVNTFDNRVWASIPDESPDDYDRHMLSEIASDPDCREFVSSSEAMRVLGL